MSLNYSGLFEAWEIAIAKSLVKEYLDKFKSLKGEEFDDLLQMVLSEWVFKKGECDDCSSQKTFMRCVLKNELNDLIKGNNRDKRRIADYTDSFDKPLNEDDPTFTLLDKLSVILNNPKDKPFLSGLKTDLTLTIAKLNSKQRKLCQLILEKNFGIQEISEYFKTSRSQVYREIKRIKQLFEQEGLKDYLP